MRFRDRRDAGEQLARELHAYALDRPVVLAIPRGGVLVADAIVRARGWPLDVAIPRKLRAPQNPELAFGAVTGDGTVYIDPALAKALRVSDGYLRDEIDAQIGEIERRRAAYRGARPEPDVRGRTAIVVDDGVATGATTRAALHATRMRNPKKLVLAVPVAPTDSLAALRSDADEVIRLEDYEVFGAIGLYYRNFNQVTDEEVIETLKRFPVSKLEQAPQPAA